MPGGLHPTLAVLATWPSSPSPHPVTRGWGLPALIIVLYIIAAFAVFGRMISRFVYMRNAGVDDAFIIMSFIALTGFIITNIGAFRYWGFDRHVWDLTPAKAVITRKVVFANDFQYTVTTSLTKISILLFYRRLSSGTVTPTFHWALRGAIAFIGLTFIAFTMTTLLSCRPLNAFWNQVDFEWAVTHIEGRDYVCYNEPLHYYINITITVIQDFMVCLMPMALFYKLKMPLRQKIALSILFGVGILTCLCAVARLYYVYMIFFGSYDVTWWAGPAYVTTCVEASFGIICASAPALKVFFKKYFNPSQAGSSFGSAITKSMRTGWSNGNTNHTNLSTVDTDAKSGYRFSSKTHTNSRLGAGPMDTELKGISVTREVEVASAYREVISPPTELRAGNFSPTHAYSFSSEKPLQNGGNRNPELPWLDDTSASTSPEGSINERSPV